MLPMLLRHDAFWRNFVLASLQVAETIAWCALTRAPFELLDLSHRDACMTLIVACKLVVEL